MTSHENFNDYSLNSYGRMIEDARRTGPFVDALRQAIRPGSVVLDIGTGTGIFAFLACRFGAARVYAVEPDASALEMAKRCADNIPGSERITWLHGLTTQMELPEQVDIVIGDLHGTLPFFKGNIESLADARKRLLKPGGRMIPSRDVLHAVPAHAPHEYRRIESPWQRNAYDLDLSAAIPQLVNTWGRAHTDPAEPQHLLSTPVQWGVVDYNATESTELDSTLEWEIERSGLMHGLYVWFDADLGEGFGYSNAPTLPELVYGRAFFPFERPVDVVPGEMVRTRLAVRLFKGAYVFRWDTRVTAADGTVKVHFEQSTFKSQPIPLSKLHKARADYVPTLTANGQVTRMVLGAMAGGKRLQAIADDVFARFPERYLQREQALDEVSRLSQKYG